MKTTEQQFLIRLKPKVGIAEFKGELERIAAEKGQTNFEVSFLQDERFLAITSDCPYLEISATAEAYRAVFETEELPPEDINKIKENANGKDEMFHILCNQPELPSKFKDKIDVMYKKDGKRLMDRILYW